MLSAPRAISNVAVVRKAAIVAGSISVLVLFGWLFDISVLKSFIPNLTATRANTAVGLGATAIAVWLSRTAGATKRWRPWVWALITAVSLMSAITLCEYAFAWNSGIDELLFRDPQQSHSPFPPGRITPGADMCFLLVSGAVLFLDSMPRLSHGFIMATLFGLLVGLIGYLYGMPTGSGALQYTTLPVFTIAGFIALCTGLLAARLDRGLPALLVASGPYHPIAEALAGAVLSPVILGSITLWGQRRGVYGSEFSLPLFSVLLAVLTVALVWIAGAERQKIDARRLQAEKELQQLNLELESRVQQRTEELNAVNKEIESFSYSVSHDLRAPLRSLSSFSQILLEDYADRLDEEGRGYLQRIEVNAQRMGHLIDDLLALAGVTRVELKRESVSVSALVRSVVDELCSRNPDRRIDFDIATGLGAQADPYLLRVVFENLLGNAWKFTAKTENARITVGRLAGEEDVFFVRDNGAGFDMKYASQLFAPFQRLHKAADFEGTGIGLATVQRIIARHHGRVWAEGKVGQGAAFFFSLGG